MKQTNHKQSGMTLIELMVTIAIVGILAAIAIPSYSYYTRSTKRSAAKTALQQVRGLLEQSYTNNKAYTTDLKQLGFTNSPLEIDKNGNEVAPGAPSIVYQITINSPGNTYCNNCDYEIVAAAMNGQLQDKSGKCDFLWFNSLGQKGSADATNNDTTNTAECW